MSDILKTRNNVEPYELDTTRTNIVVINIGSDNPADWPQINWDKRWTTCHRDEEVEDESHLADQWETIAREYGDRMNEFRCEVIELRRFLAEKDLLDTFLAWKAKAKS